VTFPFLAVFEDDSQCAGSEDFILTVHRRGSTQLTGLPQRLEVIGQWRVRLSLPEERPPQERQGDCLFSRGPLRHVEQPFEVTVTLPGG
jgi:hypothetical protein